MELEERRKTIAYCDKLLQSIPLEELQLEHIEPMEEEDYIEVLMYAIEDFNFNRRKLAQRIISWEVKGVI